VHLVSAAATPLGGDAINIRVVVEPGARLRVRTSAATVTVPGSATLQSHSFWRLEVAGDLDLDPIVADRIRPRAAARTRSDRQIR
jgi:urease accessory protein